MSQKDEPTIESDPNVFDYTCITFKPDLKKFKMDHLDKDIVSLFTKRAYDMAGVSDRRVRVKLNGKNLEIKDFKEYCDLYLNAEEHKELPKIVELKSDRWEVICSLSDG